MFQIVLNNLFCASTVFHNPKMEQMFTPHFEHFSTVKLGSSNLKYWSFLFLFKLISFMFSS